MADVHVCALAARTPVGLVAETAAAALRAGLAALTEHPTLIDPLGEPITGGFDPCLDPDLRGRYRMLELARPPLTRLLTKLSGDQAVLDSVTVLLALPEPRPGWSTDDIQKLTHSLAQLKHPGCGDLAVRSFAEGHAGGLRYLGEAADALAKGTMDLCIVGGVDSYLETATLGWLHANGLLGQTVRAGLVPGESAAFVALASARALRALGLSSLATLSAWSSVHEPPSLDPRQQGLALTSVIRATLDALPEPRSIDDIYCDMNGQRQRSEEWGFCVLRAPPRFRDPTAYTAVVDQIGDVGAATGPLLAVLAARAWARGYARGPDALLWGSSFGGTRAALIMRGPESLGVPHG